MKTIDLKKNAHFINQYVTLRNRYAHLLLTKQVTVEETKRWLAEANTEIRVLVEGNTVLGVIILYLNKDGEVTFFAKEKNKGIGSILLEIIEGVARKRGLNSLWAWVLTDNNIPQRMFEKKGYTKNRYSNREFNNKVYRGTIFKKNIVKTTHIPEKFGYKLGAREFPLMCVLSFVYICNGGCPNCPYNNSNIRQTYSDALVMPEKIFKTIADECGQHNSYLRISGGGEPMLHPQATSLMVYAKRKGCRIGLITNGSHFTEKDLSTLIDEQIDLIEFSVDALDKETYAKVRPGLDWERLYRTIEKAVKIRNDTRSSTKIIVSVINQRGVDVEEAKKYWQSRVDKVQIRKYLTWGYSKDYSQDPTPYLPPEDRIPCPWLFERFNIDSRGDVTVCGEDIAFKEKFGNILENSIKELWRHPKMEYFRQQHLKRQGCKILICGQCPDWQYRSWNYNYWKVVDDADNKRKSRMQEYV